ncbi:MAG: T9SS type A sorting domain-containing protein, partial [Bacteroidales bacterium]|nr:T9SS type A sorting domain-containing protein [Bacteroidales bacterium]
FALASDPLNELADGSYDVIPNAELVMDVIHTSMTGFDNYFLSGQMTLENHPNPFTQSTTFSYNIPVNGTVTLEIHDLTGNLVKAVVEEVEQHAGYYQVVLQNGTLQPGVYMARLKLDNNNDLLMKTIKIISR